MGIESMHHSESEESKREAAKGAFLKKEPFFREAVRQANTPEELKFAVKIGAVEFDGEPHIYDTDAGFLSAERMVRVIDSYLITKDRTIFDEGIEHDVARRLVEIEKNTQGQKN